jgi:hypothetical protein
VLRNVRHAEKEKISTKDGESLESRTRTLSQLICHSTQSPSAQKLLLRQPDSDVDSGIPCSSNRHCGLGPHGELRAGISIDEYVDVYMVSRWLADG